MTDATGEHRAAVLGRPVGHSLSPLLHRAAHAALGLPGWSYTAIECDEAGLPALLADRRDWAGFSCTMPLKRAVLHVADEVAPAAAEVGAGNTLLPRPGGGWRADNTDVDGVLAALSGTGFGSGPLGLIGAGGTAQAVLVALARAAVAADGQARAEALVRDPARAAELTATARRCGAELTLRAWTPEAAEHVLGCAVVVSTVPAGAADALAERPWRPGQVLLDVVYDPWPTPLAAAAAAAGVDVRSGALMLLHQAAAQVRLMTGRDAPVAAMREALRRARPSAGL